MALAFQAPKRTRPYTSGSSTPQPPKRTQAPFPKVDLRTPTDPNAIGFAYRIQTFGLSCGLSGWQRWSLWTGGEIETVRNSWCRTASVFIEATCELHCIASKRAPVWFAMFDVWQTRFIITHAHCLHIQVNTCFLQSHTEAEPCEKIKLELFKFESYVIYVLFLVLDCACVCASKEQSAAVVQKVSSCHEHCGRNRFRWFQSCFRSSKIKVYEHGVSKRPSRWFVRC